MIRFDFGVISQTGFSFGGGGQNFPHAYSYGNTYYHRNQINVVITNILHLLNERQLFIMSIFSKHLK